MKPIKGLTLTLASRLTKIDQVPFDTVVISEASYTIPQEKELEIVEIFQITVIDALEIYDIKTQVQRYTLESAIFVKVDEAILLAGIKLLNNNEDVAGKVGIKEILGHLTKKIKLIFPMTNTQKSKTIENFIILANENFKSKLPLKFYSDKLFIGEEVLIRKCNEVLGITPINYIVNRRMEYAKSLLATTDMPIKEVGYEVGLEDNSYFIQVFKKREGKTPHQFRRNLIIEASRLLNEY